MDARTASSDDRLSAVPSATLSGLSAVAATRALVASCDIAMLVDGKGVVREMALGSEELSGLHLDSWLNRPWADAVVPDNRAKITEMLAGTGLGRWRQVNHSTGGTDLPLRYFAIPEGSDGSLVVVGRDLRAAAALQQRLLRAQQSMERDSLRLRQLEARYRLLFDSAPEAIIVVDASTRQMTEANPAARRLAGLGGSVGGEPFAMIVHAGDRDDVIAYLGAVAAAEQRQPLKVRMADGQACWLSATLFRQDRNTSLLVRLQQMGLAEPPGSRALGEVLERMPDAFVLTDAAQVVLASNGAFLDLVGQARDEDVRGQSLWRYVGRPGIDVGIMEAQLAEHGQLRNFATIVRAAGTAEEPIEISAVTSTEAGDTHHGFSLRLVGRRLAEPVPGERQVPRSVEQLTELVGRVSLKEIVRESTDLIERLCIEAALNYTSDNRASAAEILGLSRQSLYSKLHRHGLGNLSDNEG